ncbi:DNA-binding GntR family transcriptional regulator [Sphaerisporangium siamense]|uniref:DNA-binding GntR family transcriptional regulator n=2 Tax=Sphaerisporangium siamense TaxID=795645 RepID=A0A7W7G8B9_9ACTN|nr:GntR family transcriptional regulator [Sphaerisporangium siamense]MBB4699384.1 DNA-binding GntR family transcriptional regulator [Sphaerisporangium siamense]
MRTPLRLRVLSAKDVVIEEIRALIYNGTMASGARISTDELAERFGVSRTPVRDALQQLSVEGLVTITPRVGVFVREISPQEITDVYQIKTALEPMMAAWAAERGTPEQRAAFRGAFDELERLARSDNVQEYVRALEERREALLAMARSDGLRDSFAVLDGRVRLLRFRNLSQPGRLIESAAQHRSIAEAIEAGDPDAAYIAMRDHMLDATARVRLLVVTAHPNGAPAPTAYSKLSQRTEGD